LLATAKFNFLFPQTRDHYATQTARQIVHVTITRDRVHAASAIQSVKDPCPIRN